MLRTFVVTLYTGYIEILYEYNLRQAKQVAEKLAQKYNTSVRLLVEGDVNEKVNRNYSCGIEK